MAEIIWDTETKNIEEYFKEYISRNYPSFKFRYNWNRYPVIKDYLMRLFLSSCSNNQHTDNNPLFSQKIPALISDMEEFFKSGIDLKFINEYTLPRIMKNLKDPSNGLRNIAFLPNNLKGLYGQSIGSSVEINPSFSRHLHSPDLTQDDLTRLYLFHEVGHKVLNVASNKKTIDGFCDTLDNVLESKGLINVETNFTSYVEEGFNMIEECLAQELAETLTYHSLNKKRPYFSKRKDLGVEYKTNLDFYGIFQIPTVQLGRTLRGCDSGFSSSRVILSNMIYKALYTDFADELIGEYNDGDGILYYDLFRVLRNMGFLKNQKYASFGIGRPLNVNTSDLLNAIDTITYHNIDNREYPANGFEYIDFEKFRTSSTGNDSR